MKGRAFQDVAHELLNGATEVHWRSAAGRAYYALMLEGRDVLQRWGFTPGPRENVHAFVRLRFRYAASSDLKQIGDALERLVQLRNQADYQLAIPAPFHSATHTLLAIDLVDQMLSLLDGIEADPVRRAAAIASIRP